MKRIIIFIILISAAISFFISCDYEEEESLNVVLLFRSGPSQQYAEPNSKLLYEIETFSEKAKIKSFTISSFDSEYGSQTLLDSFPNVRNFKYCFVYEVPVFSRDSVGVTLNFKAIDFDNNFEESKRTVVVVDASQILEP